MKQHAVTLAALVYTTFYGNINAQAAVKGVCIFDIDRTLTATQMGPCPDAPIVQGAFDNAYIGQLPPQPLPLKEATYGEKAVTTCIEKGFGVSFVSQAPDCGSKTLNGDAGKFMWAMSLQKNQANKDWMVLAQDNANPTQVAPNACGLVGKNVHIANIVKFWNMPANMFVYFDDQQMMLDLVKSDPNLAGVMTVLANPTRPSGVTCRELNSACCGIDQKTFLDGFTPVAANAGVATQDLGQSSGSSSAVPTSQWLVTGLALSVSLLWRTV